MEEWKEILSTKYLHWKDFKVGIIQARNDAFELSVPEAVRLMDKNQDSEKLVHIFEGQNLKGIKGWFKISAVSHRSHPELS